MIAQLPPAQDQEKMPNPDTWVREAWGRAGEGARDRLRGQLIPAGTAEAEWDMLQKHVLLEQPYAQIAKGYGEPASRIRGFVEDATRRLLPKESIQSEAGEFGGDTRAVDALIGAQRFYAAIGSPFGGDPGMVGPTLAALANHEGVIAAVRGALEAQPVELPTGSSVEIAPATSAELLQRNDDGRE